MSDTIELEEEGLLDTSIIPEGSEDAGKIVDDERVFRAAGGVSASQLAKALYKKHAPEKYPGFSILFYAI